VQYQPEHAAVKVRNAAIAARRLYNLEQQPQQLYQDRGSEHTPSVATFNAKLPLVTTVTHPQMLSHSPALQSQAGEAAQQVNSDQHISSLQGQGHAANQHGSADAVRVVGLGQRGISAAARLMCELHSSVMMLVAIFHCCHSFLFIKQPQH
jgi:hypothetical protein